METINTPNKPSRIKRAKNRIKDAVKVDVVKTHVSEHREAYIAAVVVGTAGVIAYILKPTDADVSVSVGVGGDNHGTIETTTIGTQIVSGGSNICSNLVRDKNDPSRYWNSQQEAAAALGVSPKVISKHLNRGDYLESGVELERFGTQAA